MIEAATEEGLEPYSCPAPIPERLPAPRTHERWDSARGAEVERAIQTRVEEVLEDLSRQDYCGHVTEIPPLAAKWLAQQMQCKNKQECAEAMETQADMAAQAEQQLATAEATKLPAANCSSMPEQQDVLQASCRVYLPGPDVADQEEYYEACVLLGRILGPPASRGEVEESLRRACGQGVAGLSRFPGGRFQAVFKCKEDADTVMDRGMRVKGAPVHLSRWTIVGCLNMGTEAAPLYWVRLPGLPFHCLESLDVIGAKIGVYLATRPSRSEMLNGTPPEICVQIDDSEPLQKEITLDWAGAKSHPNTFRDVTLSCNYCGGAGHCHRICARERRSGMDVELPTGMTEANPHQAAPMAARQEVDKSKLAGSK